MKILVVDDDVVSCKKLQVILRTTTHCDTVFIANSGEEGLKVVPQLLPDMILLDVLMPGLDGYQVMQRLKSNPTTCKIPVIFISGLDASEEEGKGLFMGAVDYITKPFYPPIVRARIGNHLTYIHNQNLLDREATTDSLTGVPNRSLSLEKLSGLIKEAEREKRKVAIMFLDLDGFKTINDTLGHETGDKLLIEAAQRLDSATRSTDTVGRLGGDEFICLFSGLSELSNSQSIAQNILKRFRTAFEIEGHKLMLTASIGISIYPDDGEEASDLLRKADSAMYYSKEHGRDTYSYFSDEMNRETTRRLELEEQLHGAIDRGELTVFYQPKINIQDCKLLGVEALLRWNNPVLGNVSPDEFIPIAEQTGLIVPIGQFVLSESLEALSKWQKEQFSEMNLAINLSPRQFRDPQLVSMIERKLKEYEISSQHVELEITEGLLMGNNTFVEQALEGLIAQGLVLTMDDFGTGYSSLSYLRKYDFSVLKIDRSFIKDVIVDKTSRELVNAIISMAHGLNLKVVAEGVETNEQFSYLRQAGCDYVQGFLFSEALSLSDITALISSNMRGQESIWKALDKVI